MRKSNRVKDEAFTVLPLAEQWIAANFGTKALDAGWGAMECVAHVTTALSILRLNKPGQMAKAVLKDGWLAMLRPPPSVADGPGKLFYDQASRAVVAIMKAVTLAVETHNADDIRKLVDAIEAGTHGIPKDPLASYFLGLFECTPETGKVKKQVHFPTANEALDYVKRYPFPPDIKTIRRRKKEMGIVFRDDKKGAPPGKRRSGYRADG